MFIRVRVAQDADDRSVRSSRHLEDGDVCELRVFARSGRSCVKNMWSVSAEN
jgi:hypothetical protein